MSRTRTIGFPFAASVIPGAFLTELAEAGLGTNVIQISFNDDKHLVIECDSSLSYQDNAKIDAAIRAHVGKTVGPYSDGMGSQGVNARAIRTVDGRDMVRTSVTNRTISYSHRSMFFRTAKLDSLHNVNPVTGLDWGDVTISLFDADGEAIDDPASAGQAVMTVLDWEAQYSYEIIGGSIDIDPTLSEGDTNEWYVSAIGAPDYPPQVYGSIPFVGEMNLEMIADHRIAVDGRSPQLMAYQFGGYPRTNLLRFIFKHPAGAQKRFQIHMDHYL